MSDGGYIKLYRSLLKWEWYNDINAKILFLHLLLTVNYEDKKWQGIVIKRGQRVASYATLAHESSLSVKSVRTALSHLITTGEVAHKATSKYGLFTVINYEKYQETAVETTDITAVKGQSEGSQGAVKGQQHKNIKNIKNINKYIGNIFSEYCKGDEELLKAFSDFEDMRNKKKKPMTDKAKSLLISTLEKISMDKQTQISLLQKSILNGWSSVYPDNSISQKKPEKRKNLGNFDTDEINNLFLRPEVNDDD